MNKDIRGEENNVRLDLPENMTDELVWDIFCSIMRAAEVCPENEPHTRDRMTVSHILGSIAWSPLT